MWYRHNFSMYDKPHRNGHVHRKTVLRVLLHLQNLRKFSPGKITEFSVYTMF